MSRPHIFVSGVLALLTAGALSLAPRTASAGVMPVDAGEFVSPQNFAGSREQSRGVAIDEWWRPTLPASRAFSQDRVTDFQFSPMFSDADSTSVGSEPTTTIAVSLPNHFAASGLGQVRGEHVNSIPDLPALWSGLTSLAGILTAGTVKRVRRALK